MLILLCSLIVFMQKANCDVRSSSRSRARAKSKTFLRYVDVPCDATNSLIFLILWDINTVAEVSLVTGHSATAD